MTRRQTTQKYFMLTRGRTGSTATLDDLGEVVATPRVRQPLDDLTGLDRQLYQCARRKSERTGSTAIA